ncbi:hypothetical protein WA158_004347 [Blastocystis sp. Blastoise]
MGKNGGKKKDKGVTFELMHRNIEDPLYNQGFSKLVLVPKSYKDQKKASKMKEFAPYIASGGIGGGSIFGEFQNPDENANETISETPKEETKKDIEENDIPKENKIIMAGQNTDIDGFPLDGYDYSKHLRPIDESGVFVAAGGAIVDDGFVYKGKTELPEELRPEYLKTHKLMEAVDLKEYEVDQELLDVIEKAENSDTYIDFSDDDEDVDKNDLNLDEETIMDQFIKDANKESDEITYDFQAHIRKLLAEQEEKDKKYGVEMEDIDDLDYDEDDIDYDEDDIIDDTIDHDNNNNEGDYDDYDDYDEDEIYSDYEYSDDNDQREKRDIDNYFDVVIKDYKDDELYEGEEQQGHILNNDGIFNEILDEFITEKQNKNFFKDLDQGKVDEFNNRKEESELSNTNNTTNDNDTSISFADKMKTLSISNPDAIQADIQIDSDSDDEQFKQMDMDEPKENDDFDAESICSTYSNTENHPHIIKIKRKPKIIKLSKKTGLPIREKEEEISEDDMKEEEEEEENEVVLPDVITKRDKSETKEEKKARKAAAKEAQRIKRQQKKELKNKFKEEEKKIVSNSQTTKANSVFNME